MNELYPYKPLPVTEIVADTIRILQDTCIGVLQAKKNNDIAIALRAYGHGVSERTVRRIMWVIRNEDLIAGLCAHPQHGYWIAEDIEELSDTLDSLRNRLINQLRTYRSLKRQLYRLKLNENFKLNTNSSPDSEPKPGSTNPNL